MGPNRGDPGRTHGASFWFHCTLAVLGHPRLWFAALRQFVRAVPARWWARLPYLPVPDRGYLRFRFETAYGVGSRPQVSDLLRYLSWCRETTATRR